MDEVPMMNLPAELTMRQYSPDPPAAYPTEYHPFDHALRRCLTGMAQGAAEGARAGFSATTLVWIARLLLLPAPPHWPLGLAAISLIGGLLGTLTGAALGMALADEE